MKNKTSRILALLMVLFIPLTLAACFEEANDAQMPSTEAPPETHWTVSPTPPSAPDSSSPDEGDDSAAAGQEEDPAEGLRNALALHGSAPDRSMEAFFRYYAYNNHELRFLPSFDTEKAADWNDLILFSAFQSEYENIYDQDGNFAMPAAEVDRVMGCFFPAVTYTHKSSAMFRYDEKTGYTVDGGFDAHGATHYRLVSLTETDGVWTAVFDSFTFREDDYIPPENGGSREDYSLNMNALMDFNGGKHPGTGFHDVLLALFLKSSYDEILQSQERVQITFELQDNAEHPLRYLSCEKQDAR